MAPTVHPYGYGSLTVRGKRVHLGAPRSSTNPTVGDGGVETSDPLPDG